MHGLDDMGTTQKCPTHGHHMVIIWHIMAYYGILMHMDAYGLFISNRLNMSTFWLFNIAMEHGPFIDGLAIENG